MTMHEKFDKEAIPEIREMGRKARLQPRAADVRRMGDTVALNVAGNRTMRVARSMGEALADARDFLQLFDMPGFLKVMKASNDERFREVAGDIEQGDDAAAAEIEKVLSRIESHLLITTGAKVGDDVTGAVPNIGAYVAGNPMNMRTRRNEKNARGPISLFLETTTSAGFSGREGIYRMAAMVALARALAVHRPLNLWLNISWGGQGKLTQCSIQLETSPIDLSRLASFLAHLNFCNSVGSGLSRDQSAAFMRQTGFGWGSWAYGIPELERTYAGEILGRVISPGSQIAYLPAGLYGEDNLTAPEVWVKSMLEKYSPYLFDGIDREEWDAA